MPVAKQTWEPKESKRSSKEGRLTNTTQLFVKPVIPHHAGSLVPFFTNTDSRLFELFDGLLDASSLWSAATTPNGNYALTCCWLCQWYAHIYIYIEIYWNHNMHWNWGNNSGQNDSSQSFKLESSVFEAADSSVSRDSCHSRLIFRSGQEDRGMTSPQLSITGHIHELKMQYLATVAAGCR